MAGIRVEGNTSGNVAEVDANNNLKTNLPTTISQAGFAGLAGKNDDGSVVAGGRINRVYVTEGQGLKMAAADLLWDDTFNATAQNTSKYRYASSATITSAQTAGFLVINSGSSNAININAALQTFKTFPLFAKSELRINISALFTQVPQVNETYEWGLFQATLPGAAIPTDGVFFRRNTAAQLVGVMNYNGTETQTAAFTAPSANVNHDYVIVVQTNTVLFYIDDILQAKITLVTDDPTRGQPMMEASCPLTIRYYIGGSAPALASQIKVSDVFITALGPDLGRPFSEMKAGFGHMAYQGQNGGTMGSTSNYSNAALPAASALTNTALGTGNPAGLGGVAHVLPTLTVGTDGLLFSFQNPAGGVNQTPRNLIIRGVTIRGGVDVVFAGGPLVCLYSVAYGHTAISLATAELGSFVTGTTKAPRRVVLGVETYIVTAPAGTAGQGVSVAFTSPIVVAPGEFFAITMRTFGTVTSTGSLVIACGVDGYFE